MAKTGIKGLCGDGNCKARIGISVRGPFSNISSVKAASSAATLSVPSGISGSTFCNAARDSIVVSKLCPKRTCSVGMFTSIVGGASAGSRAICSFGKRGGKGTSLGPAGGATGVTATRKVVTSRGKHVCLAMGTNTGGGRRGGACCLKTLVMAPRLRIPKGVPVCVGFAAGKGAARRSC